MKPLSPFNFSRNNSKKLITSIISVLAAVAFIYMLQTFVRSMYTSIYRIAVSPYRTEMRILGIDNKKPVPENIVTRIMENENIEKAIPFLSFNTRFVMPGGIAEPDVLGLRTLDMDYVMEKHNMKLLKGRLPREGSREIALDIKIARNKKVNIGDKIGTAVDSTDYLPGEYTVVGILEGKDYISLIPYNTKEGIKLTDNMELFQTAILIFPKEGRIDEVDDLLSSLPKNEVKANSLRESQAAFEKNTEVMRVIDVICILAIIVMVIATVSSKYVQFFNRRQELGILNAIGYTKLQIMKKTLLEVALVNLAGFVLGICFGILGSLLLTKLVFVSIGGIGVIIYYKAFLMTLFIPLFTILFTLVPVNRMITRIDPIIMIEGVN